MNGEPTFSQRELELLSDLVGLHLEIDDLNQKEFGEAKALLEKIEDLIV